MKKIFHHFFVSIVLLFAPLIVFGCAGDTFYISPFSFVFLFYFIITGTFYFLSYKKLTDGRKWNFWQYLLILSITIPSLLLVWGILTSMPTLSLLQDKSTNGLPGRNNENILMSILVIIALVTLIAPLVFKKKWIYKWGLPLYVLIAFSLYLLFDIMFTSLKLCY